MNEIYFVLTRMILHYLRLLKKSPKFILNSILMDNDNINVVWDPHTLYMMSDELLFPNNH